MGRVSSRDPIFNDPRLAALYDEFDDDRSDLDVYVDLIVNELGATKVLDVGCGTGSLASLLAARDVDVIGIDPAAASLDVARTKPHAQNVRWIHGVVDDELMAKLGNNVDLAIMTGNVAQVFLDDAEWAATLEAIRGVLRPSGFLVFETRDPAKEAWLGWQSGMRESERDVAGVGIVKQSTELVSVELPLVSFRHHYDFVDLGERFTSDSTLRFRSRAEISASLAAAGFAVKEVRDAPDRPGLEFVFVAQR